MSAPDREPPAHKRGKHCTHADGRCCWCVALAEGKAVR